MSKKPFKIRVYVECPLCSYFGRSYMDMSKMITCCNCEKEFYLMQGREKMNKEKSDKSILKGKLIWSGRYLGLIIPANIPCTKTYTKWVRIIE